MIMPSDTKSAYTAKQKRMAEHIEESYERRGVPEEEAEARAWATVNKQTGGGRRTAQGRHNADARLEAREEEHQRRSEAARKGWETRRRNSGASSPR
jgi:hypothetical protein